MVMAIAGFDYMSEESIGVALGALGLVAGLILSVWNLNSIIKSSSSWA